eukprot:COSAG03_NODE_4946_length_1382_cov_8.247857_1_plen_200_part_10
MRGSQPLHSVRLSQIDRRTYRLGFGLDWEMTGGSAACLPMQSFPPVNPPPPPPPPPPPRHSTLSTSPPPPPPRLAPPPPPPRPTLQDLFQKLRVLETSWADKLLSSAKDLMESFAAAKEAGSKAKKVSLSLSLCLSVSLCVCVRVCARLPLCARVCTVCTLNTGLCAEQGDDDEMSLGGVDAYDEQLKALLGDKELLLGS